MKWAGASDADGGSALPPLSRGGSAALPALAKQRAGTGPGLAHNKDVAALLAEYSQGGCVARSPLSGSSKAPFPPDRNVVNDFTWTLHSRDLPEAVRPIIEDNKMMQEELRRYKMRAGEQEGLLAAKDRQMAALRDEVARLRQQLQQCSVAPDDVMREGQFRQELKDRDGTIQELQRKTAVLEHSRNATERRLTNDLAAERRQQAELRRQLKQLQDEVADKQKQARFNQLHINQLYRRLEPLEAAVSAAAAPPSPPPAEPAPKVEPEEKVHLMLCFVYAQPQPTAGEIAEAAARLAGGEMERQLAALWRGRAEAATRIQAAFRGLSARRQLAAQQQAATRIQAAARGMLARRAVAPLVHLERRGASPTHSPVARQASARHPRAGPAVAAKARQAEVLPRAGSQTPTRLRTANTAPEALARLRGRQGTAKGPAEAAAKTCRTSGPAEASGRAGSTLGPEDVAAKAGSAGSTSKAPCSPACGSSKGAVAGNTQTCSAERSCGNIDSPLAGTAHSSKGQDAAGSGSPAARPSKLRLSIDRGGSLPHPHASHVRTSSSGAASQNGSGSPAAAAASGRRASYRSSLTGAVAPSHGEGLRHSTARLGFASSQARMSITH